MKGLIIKDYYYLKKSMGMLMGICGIVIFLAVMFTISARCGNVAKAIAETANEAAEMGLPTEEEFYAIYRYVIWIVLTIISVGFIPQCIEAFKEDRKANFSKLLFSLPIKETEIVGARYLSCLLDVVVGLMFSSVAAAIISSASDRLPFQELLSVVITVSGLLIIFVSVVMPLIYLWGADKADWIQILILGSAFAGMAYKVYRTMNSIGNDSVIADTEEIEAMIDMLNDVNTFLTTKGLLVFGAALVVFIVSYFCSVYIVKIRRGRAI